MLSALASCVLVSETSFIFTIDYMST